MTKYKEKTKGVSVRLPFELYREAVFEAERYGVCVTSYLKMKLIDMISPEIEGTDYDYSPTEYEEETIISSEEELINPNKQILWTE